MNKHTMKIGQFDAMSVIENPIMKDNEFKLIYTLPAITYEPPPMSANMTLIRTFKEFKLHYMTDGIEFTGI